MFRRNFPNLCLVSFKLFLHLLLLEWEIMRSPVYSSWLCWFLSESETPWICQQAQRGGCMDFGLTWWTVGAAVWYCPYAAEGCPKRLPAENVCCPLFTLTRREVQECWSSTITPQVSVHHLSFSFQVQRVPPYGASCFLILRHLGLA